MKDFIRKVKKPFEWTPEQLRYAETELKTIFGLKNGTKKRIFIRKNDSITR